jgi:hypothetical protein
MTSRQAFKIGIAWLLLVASLLARWSKSQPRREARRGADPYR